MATVRTISPAPIERCLRVRAPRTRVFDTFTRDIGRWWPRQYSISTAAQLDVRMEPCVGGRWYELLEDGSEVQFGRVLEWQPPERVVLAWQLTAAWTFDPDFETIVDVRFHDADGETIVELSHRHLERYGEAAERQHHALDDGWHKLLELMKAAAEPRPAEMVISASEEGTRT